MFFFLNDGGGGSANFVFMGVGIFPIGDFSNSSFWNQFLGVIGAMAHEITIRKSFARE